MILLSIQHIHFRLLFQLNIICGIGQKYADPYRVFRLPSVKIVALASTGTSVRVERCV